MNPLKHVNARTIEEAISAAGVKALVIAGGTDCLSLFKNRILPNSPKVLVNIKTIPGLAYIMESGDGLRIGALTRLSNLAASAVVREKYGLLAEAAQSVASPQIRNMGTIGGNLCQDTRCWYYRCSPFTGRSYFCSRKGGRLCFAVKGDNRYHAIFGGRGCFAVCPSDLAVALAALEAEIAVQGPAGRRTIPIRDFFTISGNSLQPNELVTEIRIPPLPEGASQTFLKFRLRKAIDFAIVSVASVIASEGGLCREARIALGAVAPYPLRAVAAESALAGQVVNAETAALAAQAAVVGATPLGMNAYKIEIVKALVKKALLL